MKNSKGSNLIKLDGNLLASLLFNSVSMKGKEGIQIFPKFKF